MEDTVSFILTWQFSGFKKVINSDYFGKLYESLTLPGDTFLDINGNIFTIKEEEDKVNIERIVIFDASKRTVKSKVVHDRGWFDEGKRTVDEFFEYMLSNLCQADTIKIQITKIIGSTADKDSLLIKLNPVIEQIDNLIDHSKVVKYSDVSRPYVEKTRDILIELRSWINKTLTPSLFVANSDEIKTTEKDRAYIETYKVFNADKKIKTMYSSLKKKGYIVDKEDQSDAFLALFKNSAENTARPVIIWDGQSALKFVINGLSDLTTNVGSKERHLFIFHPSKWVFVNKVFTNPHGKQFKYISTNKVKLDKEKKRELTDIISKVSF